MKSSKWAKIESRFTWNMCKDTEEDDWTLDFDVPDHLEDGMYYVHAGCDGFNVCKYGIEVKSGQIVPNKTTRGAIYLVSLCADLDLVGSVLENRGKKLKPKNLKNQASDLLDALDWNEEHEWFEARFDCI